jgi:mRNA-degrading endonuclease RelE of RelBE toxin-antitoxin system
VKVEFAASFRKDIKRLRDGALCARLEKTILSLEEAASLADIAQLKTMSGHPNRYRIRIGDYRLGLQTEGDAIVLVRFLHRKEIYKNFP